MIPEGDGNRAAVYKLHFHCVKEETIPEGDGINGFNAIV